MVTSRPLLVQSLPYQVTRVTIGSESREPRMKVVKYKYKFLYLLDLVSYVMTYPWVAMLSLFLSCYWSTTFERTRPANKAIQYVIFGPILGFLVTMTFPMAVFGFLLWMIMCNGKRNSKTFFSKRKKSFILFLF